MYHGLPVEVIRGAMRPRLLRAARVSLRVSGPAAAPPAFAPAGAARRALSSSAPAAGKRPRPVTDYVGMTLFGSLVVGTFGLGAWQADRYFWKEALIEERKRVLGREPQSLKELLLGNDPLPAGAAVIDDPALHYTRVSVRGTFDHTNEILIGPRVPPKRAHGGGMDIAEVGGESDGFIVVTPLMLEEGEGSAFQGGGIVLVNRGWIPNPEKTKFKTEPSLRFTTGPVTVTGVVHPPEQPRMLSPPNDIVKRKFLWFDPIAAAHAAGLTFPEGGRGDGVESSTCPLIVNQTEPCNPGMFPVMKDMSSSPR